MLKNHKLAKLMAIFHRNIGFKDRFIRFILACFILAYAYLESSWIATILGLFIFYETIAGWCLLYQLLGLNSCPISPHQKTKK
jgi:hypothetical protein